MLLNFDRRVGLLVNLAKSFNMKPKGKESKEVDEGKQQ